MIEPIHQRLVEWGWYCATGYTAPRYSSIRSDYEAGFRDPQARVPVNEIRAEQTAQAVRALSNIYPVLGDAVVRFYRDNHSYTMIAQQTQVYVSTVTRRIDRAHEYVEGWLAAQ